MKSPHQKLLNRVTSGSLWQYKEKVYRVQTTPPMLLSQDPNGEWVPSVIYVCHNDTNRDTQVVGSIEYRFSRPITEFLDKFQPMVIR